MNENGTKSDRHFRDADIFWDDVHVGIAEGEVIWTCKGKYVPFKPANELSPAKMFWIPEVFKVVCRDAHLVLSRIRPKYGHDFALSLKPRDGKKGVIYYKACCATAINLCSSDEVISFEALEFNAFADRTRAKDAQFCAEFETPR